MIIDDNQTETDLLNNEGIIKYILYAPKIIAHSVSKNLI